MKKSLVTLAMMAAFAPAFAQSNVTVYGVVDAGIESSSVAGKDTTSLVSGGGWSSRVGFKGVEDLGGGLSAKFVLEQGFNVDTGTEATAGSAFSRQAWLGLGTNVGEVRVGRQNSLIYEQTAGLDPFQIGLEGNALKFLGLGGYQQRVSNALTYITPSVSGLQGRFQYGFGETADKFSANNTVGFNASYNAGPLGLALTHNTQKFNTASVDAKQTDMLLGGTYDFSVAKAHVGYGQSKYEVLGATAKVNNVLLGVSAPLAGGTVLASYIRSDVKDLDSGKSEQFAVGYTYPLSKRTKVYTSYAHVSNDANVGLISGVNGETASKFNVGINHAF